MIRVELPEIIVGHTVTLSTIIGRAASIGRMRITTDMMTVMTDSGTSGSSDNKGFQNFRFQLFLNASLFSYSVVEIAEYI